MGNTNQATKKALALFAIACLVTTGFLTALQFAQMPWLAIFLIIMHGGIACFIFSRRAFKKLNMDVGRYFIPQYLLLIPYLLVMVYIILLRVGLPDILGETKSLLVIAYSVIYLIFSVFNFLRIKKTESR